MNSPEIHISDSDSESAYKVKSFQAKYNCLISECISNYNTSKENNSKLLKFGKMNDSKDSFNLMNSIETICNKAGENYHSKNYYKRRIPKAPERILDAPELEDDYYLNLLDWSQTNRLAVCLGHSLYVWNAYNGQINTVMTHSPNNPNNILTSVSWSCFQNQIAIGTNDNMVQIWDVEKSIMTDVFQSHNDRVSALSWNPFSRILTSGSRDSCINHYDSRISKSLISSTKFHNQEVCNVKWSCDGRYLASGGNDNLLCLWEITNINPKFVLRQHRAAVKGIAWCPFENNILVSGAGTSDHTIKIWNANSGELINSINTDSQVCSLAWNSEYKELISAHGYSQNQIIIWKYPQMKKITELKGHKARVLHLCISPDNNTIVSAAADETLRFWKLSNKKEVNISKNKFNNENKLIYNRGINIR